MKRLTCEMCGGTDLVKKDGVYYLPELWVQIYAGRSKKNDGRDRWSC